MSSNHTQIATTLARDVELNLGGGAAAVVNLHLNEEGFLLIEGLDLPDFEYGIECHGRNLAELQILATDGSEDDDDDY